MDDGTNDGTDRRTEDDDSDGTNTTGSASKASSTIFETEIIFVTLSSQVAAFVGTNISSQRSTSTEKRKSLALKTQ